VKNTDKFLLAIVLGAVVLIGATFAVVFLKPEPTYLSDDSPEGVAHNYLLALQRENYGRAYRYLSNTLPGYPSDIEQFEESFENYSWRIRTDTDSSLAIDSSTLDGTRAVVTVRETRFYDRGLFESSQQFSTFDMVLHLEIGEWKIVSSKSYFAWCWDDENGCR